MNNATPHYLLRSEANRIGGSGHWRFVLKPLDGSDEIAAADIEPDVWGERLDLLTVVRALESLDQPSWVTLIGCTRYVEQGVLYGVTEWKDNGWRWECFGQMTPVRDTDLWQRMDRILQFHRVDCGQRRFDGGHNLLQGPHWSQPNRVKDSSDSPAVGNWVKYHALAMTAWCGLWAQMVGHVWRRFAGVGLENRG